MLEGGMQIVQGFFGRNEDGGLVFFLLFLRADMLLGIFVHTYPTNVKRTKK